MTNSPEREAAFQKLKATHGSFWKFHGSPFHNWHSILRTNLRNVSGTKLMRVGQAHGPGIYLASNSQTSRYESCNSCNEASPSPLQETRLAPKKGLKDRGPPSSNVLQYTKPVAQIVRLTSADIYHSKLNAGLCLEDERRYSHLGLTCASSRLGHLFTLIECGTETTILWKSAGSACRSWTFMTCPDFDDNLKSQS